MTEGSVDDLSHQPDGIVIGDGLARKLSIGMGENMTLSAANQQVRTFEVVGIFHTGRANYDERPGLRQPQARPGAVRPAEPGQRHHRQARPIPIRRAPSPRGIEASIGYKSVSWQEATEDLMATLTIRNIIMYTVVSAVLVVAAFGIYNVISTVVLEKRRDIAILKSMGFHARDIQRVFVMEGLLLGDGGLGVRPAASASS